MFTNDPNVVVRTPGSDFTPSVDMVQNHPYITEDFFKRLLDENQLRRYLFERPKNTLRQYDPPKLNNVQLSPSAKLVDIQLAHIQYRLSGITRPLDRLTYRLLQGNWDLPTLQQQSRDIVVAMYEHLSDIASHITTLRTQNVYRGIPRRVEAPPKSDDNLLLDTTAMVEHIKLQRAVQQATQLQSNRKRNNGPRSKRSAFGNTNQPTHSSPSSAESDPVSQATHQSSSWDFQQRTHQQENQLVEAGGRLSLFAPAWSSSSGFSLHPWILNILQNGYQIPLVSPPPLRLSPAYQPSPRSISNSISTSQVIDQELSTLLDRRTIEPVQSSNTPSFLSNLFIILKKDGGLHPVLNLKQLNQYLSTQHFKMETMKTITHLQ